jgi:hypothetical protein
MKKLISIAALAAFAAVAEDKPSMPKPAEELKVEKWFVGNWTCAGKQNPGPMGPGGEIASKLSIKMELAGFWLNFEVNATKGPMKGEVSEGFSTWDAAAKTHVRYDFNAGPSWIRFTSPGWDGDKLIFDGEAMMGGQKIPARHTLTKKGDNQFQGVFEMAGADGKLAVMEDSTCKRAAGKK